MYCTGCGAELPEEARFCPNCGEKAAGFVMDGDTADSTIELVWQGLKRGGGEKQQDDMQREAQEDSLKESVSVPQYQDAAQEAEALKTESKFITYWKRLDRYTKVTVVGTAACSLLCFVSFAAAKVAAGIVALLQVCLFVIAYLIYREIIKVGKQRLHIILGVVAGLFVFPYFGLMCLDVGGADAAEENGTEVTEVFQWPESELAAMLPVPKSNVGYINKETAGELSVYVADSTKEDYNEYIQACTDKGFNVVKTREKDVYCADNAAGYRVSLEFADGNAMIVSIKETPVPMEIVLDCAENMLFNKYNMEICIDDIEVGILGHGSKDTFKVELDRGQHTLRITEEGSSSVFGVANFEVADTARIFYTLSCHTNHISVKEEYTESLVPLAEGQAKVPASSEEYESQICDSVFEELSAVGFTNITRKEIPDLTDGRQDADGKIETVSIGGKTEFRKAEVFDKDTEIIISYHTFAPSAEAPEPANQPLDNPSEEAGQTEGSETESSGLDNETDEELEAVSEMLDPYIGRPLAEVMAVLEEMGYTSTYTAQNTGMDFTYAVMEDEPTRDVFVTTGFRNIDTEARTVEVMMLGKDTIEEQKEQKESQKTLEETLDPAVAWAAAEEYGKMIEPSFELHYLKGKLAEEAEDENTWFLKALCSVKTEKGKVQGTCEARVTGTDDYPIVIYFYAY